MARITDQDIPGALVALFGSYAAKGKATQGASGTLRARRRVKKRPYKRRPNKYHAALWPLCLEAATNYAARYTGTPIPPLALRIFAQAKRGTFPAKWWTSLIHSTTTYHSTAPTSAPRPSPNPYAYRDPNNRPTIPTYPAASAGAAPARYTGATTAQEFKDTLLVFRRDTFTADPPAGLHAGTRLIYQATGNTSAAASTRAARPLLGLTAAAAAGAPGVSPITNTAPPIGKGAAVYPRYRNKKTPAPYYSASAAYNLTRLLNPARAPVPPATFERATIDIAPLPAMGYRYNNNTSIATSTALTATPSARIPLQPLPAAPMVTNYPAMTLLISPYTGESIGALDTAQQANQYAAGLYYYKIIDANTMTLHDVNGGEYGPVVYFPTDAQNYVAPYAWPGGWECFWYYATPNPEHWIRIRYTWQGTIAEYKPLTTDAEIDYAVGNHRLLRSPGFGQSGDGTPSTLHDYDPVMSFWNITGLPPSTIGAASVDGLHFVSLAGNYYFANYPSPHPGTPGAQPPITPTLIANVGFNPTTVHRANAGMLTWSAATGYRLYQANATYTQLSLTTAATPAGYSSTNYKIT